MSEVYVGYIRGKPRFCGCAQISGFLCPRILSLISYLLLKSHLWKWSCAVPISFIRLLCSSMDPQCLFLLLEHTLRVRTISFYILVSSFTYDRYRTTLFSVYLGIAHSHSQYSVYFCYSNIH